MEMVSMTFKFSFSNRISELPDPGLVGVGISDF